MVSERAGGKRGKIAGIIDFGDIEASDPAYDSLFPVMRGVSLSGMG